jgi:hypothetical protein
MNYSTACEILGFTTPKSLIENAELAARKLAAMAPNAPLKYKVACDVLMQADE